MKKKLVGLLAAVMVLSMGMTAFAADSPKAESKDVTTNRNDVKVYTASKEEISAAQSQAAAINKNADVLAVVDVKYTGNKADLAKGVQITLNVAGVKKGDNIVILHQNTVTGKWERIPVTAVGDGWVTGTFTDLSPVAIVKLPASGSSTSSSAKYATSPKTGQ